MAYATTNPYTGEVLKSFPEATDAEVKLAIEEAHSAFLAWKETSLRRARAHPAEGCRYATQLSPAGAWFASEDTHHTFAGGRGKTALRPLTDTDTGVALACSLLGVSSPGNGFRREESGLSLVVSVPLDRTLVHANLGVLRTESDNRTAGVYAFLVERLGETGFDFGIETFGEINRPPWVGTGARYAIVPKTLFVDASAAVQTNGARSRAFTVGLKYAF